MVIARLFDKEFEMRGRYWFVLPDQRTKTAYCDDAIAPVRLARARDIQKHADLGMMLSEDPLVITDHAPVHDWQHS
jgi:hypothetical protein